MPEHSWVGVNKTVSSDEKSVTRHCWLQVVNMADKDGSGSSQKQQEKKESELSKKTAELKKDNKKLEDANKKKDETISSLKKDIKGVQK